jgi:protein O-mannosyl-transferase
MNTPPRISCRRFPLFQGPALICLGILLLVLVVFCRTRGYGFIELDDDFYVTGNWHVIQGISWKNALWALGAGTGRFMTETDYWMPLSLISQMADTRAFGMNPGLRHLENVLIHAFSAMLLFLVLRSMTGSVRRSAFVAAIWAIHPLRVESVAWISERKEVLGGFFFMLSLAAYLRHVRTPSLPNALLLFLSFLLGVMSKPTVVTLPAVLLLLDFWPLKRLAEAPQGTRLRMLIREKLPLFALSLCSCVMTVVTQKQTLDPHGQAPLFLRFGNAAIALCIYLKKTFLPSDLAVFYPYPPEGRPLWQVGAALLMLSTVTACVMLLRKNRPYLAAGWFWFLVMIAPASGILKAGGQAYADRFTYLPQIGLLIAVTWLTSEWATNRIRTLCLEGAALAALLGLTIAAYRQVGFWSDSITLFTRALECTQANPLIHNNLGSVFWHQGKAPEAIREIETALRLDPHYAEAQNNLGTILWDRGERAEAVACFEKSLELQPYYGAAQNNLGNALLQSGSVREALPHLRMAVAIIPGSEGARFNLGTALMLSGDVQGALGEFQKALAINPSGAATHNSLGSLLCQTGHPEEGIEELRKAVALEPDNASYLNNCAWAILISPHQTHGDLLSSLELATRANRIEGGTHPGHLRTLAAALAKSGDFPRSIEMANRALELARKEGNQGLAAAVQRELLAYRAGRSSP